MFGVGRPAGRHNSRQGESPVIRFEARHNNEHYYLSQQTRALAGTTIPSHPATSSSLPPTAHTDLPQHSYASNDAPASRLTFPGGSHIDLQEFAAQEAYNVQLAAFSNVFEPSEAAELTFDTNALPLALPANALHLNIYPFAQGLPPAFTPPLTQSSSPESIYSSLNGTPSPLATPYFPDVRVVSPNIGDYNSAPHMQAETIAGPSSTPGQYMPLFVPGHGYYLVSSAACIPHSDVHCAVPPPMPDSLYPSQEPASQIPLPPPQLHAKRKAKRHNKPKKLSTRSTPKSDALGQKKPKAKLQCTVEGCSVTFTTPKDRMRHFKEQHKEDQDVYHCPTPTLQ